jgi:glyoxylase-like metal-dependent hydrolase (beta-lactamase superfamily II)
VALFSGDTLFAGDVGRPDLRDPEVGTRERAAMMYDSLFHKLLRLPPEVRVYPAHRRWIVVRATDFFGAIHDNRRGGSNQLGT